MLKLCMLCSAVPDSEAFINQGLDLSCGLETHLAAVTAKPRIHCSEWPTLVAVCHVIGLLPESYVQTE